MEKVKAAFNPNKDVTLGGKEDKHDGSHHESQIESSIGGGNTQADITDKDVTTEGPHGENSSTSLGNQAQEAKADVKPGSKP